MVEFLRESIVFCSTCTMSLLKKFTFAISSADELLVTFYGHYTPAIVDEHSKRICLVTAAPSDSVSRALSTNSLTYLLTYLHTHIERERNSMVFCVKVSGLCLCVVWV